MSNNFPRASFEVVDFPALCQQVVACLRQYEGWVNDFREDLNDDRFDEHLQEVRKVREAVKEWLVEDSSPVSRHQVFGVDVYDGGKDGDQK